MAYLRDMPATCRNRSTNPEFPLSLLKSISGEFDKGLNGGIFDASYVLGKLETITRHVKWLERQAEDEWATEVDDGEKFAEGYTGGHSTPNLEDDRE